jgi:hypothetical protein
MHTLNAGILMDAYENSIVEVIQIPSDIKREVCIAFSGRL